MGFDENKFQNSPQRLGMRRGSERAPNKQTNKQTNDREALGNRLQSIKKNIKREDFLADQQGITEQLDELWKKYRASYSLEDENNLKEFAAAHNMRLSVYKEVSKDERSEIARMAFNGTVERPYAGYSEAYKDIVDNPIKYASVQHSKDDYNLDDSGLWKVMKQFPEFAAIEKRIVSGLAKAGVPPEILPSMNTNDFRHLLFTHCSAGQSSSFAKIFPQTDENGNIIRDFRTQKPLTTSAKQRNTIRFITEHPEFADVMMRIPGARKDYVDELVNQMKKGNTDMTPFLSRHPEWKDQTAINLHHIVNIKDCRLLEEQGRPIGDINEYGNMCFMACGTLEEIVQKKCTKTSKHEKLPGVHGVMHNHDTTFRNGAMYRPKWGEHTPPSGQDVIARMEPAPGTCCMLAFGKDFMITDEKRNQLTLEQQQQRSTPDQQKNMSQLATLTEQSYGA